MIQITVQILGGLGSTTGTPKRRLSSEGGTTIAALLATLGLPDEQVGFVVVNGDVEHDRKRFLAGGEVVELYPWMMGGA